ncbi:hypothetical protein IE53DRAFT_343779 [Violaceomyces palustris]|uniref:Uncharacterized protein n=1 Tax=Violaceomyces palustris TaxID=1673888 RepID=A0ACD0NXP4_9BASI|nr:hypothetical protein IE53DRAFT_343779 [Violaceomyces palustris]
MDKSWAPLAPNKPSLAHPNLAKSAEADKGDIAGLPYSTILRILDHVPVPDLVNCALAGRRLAEAVADDSLWSDRLRRLSWTDVVGLPFRYSATHLDPESSVKKAAFTDAEKPEIQAADDEFGDFEGPNAEAFEGITSFGTLSQVTTSTTRTMHASSGTLGSAQGWPKPATIFSYGAERSSIHPSREADSSYQIFKQISVLLKPFILSLLKESSPTSSLVFSHSSLDSLSSQAALLGNIARFIGPSVQGVSVSESVAGQGVHDPSDDAGPLPDSTIAHLRSRVREAADYLEGVLLAAFEGADARRCDAIRAGKRGIDVQQSIERSEQAMKEQAWLVWQLAEALAMSHEKEAASSLAVDRSSSARGGAAAALLFLERREIFYQAPKHDCNRNLVEVNGHFALDFTAMDAFMSEVVKSVREEGSLIARIFPPEQDVLLAFADRVASDVISEYIAPLLARSRDLSAHLYLQACAASFIQALRLVDALLLIEPKSHTVNRERCEDVIYRMWEINMDEYLQEEREWVALEMATVCKAADTNNAVSAPPARMDAAFLSSQNPAAVKRSVLTGFKDVLLLPVTVVPRTAGLVGGAMIRTAGSGLSQLNPLRWQASSSIKSVATQDGALDTRTFGPKSTDKAMTVGYIDFSNGNPDDVDDEDVYGDDQETVDVDNGRKNTWDDFKAFENVGDHTMPKAAGPLASPATFPAVSSRPDTPGSGSTATLPTQALTKIPTAEEDSKLSRLQLLLSIDTALQLIQINREALKRIETFKGFPGNFGSRVKEEIEEISVLFFQCLSERHVVPGFVKATAQIETWRSKEHGEDPVSHVAPLVHFFELVHVGDTIQQMVQVYYDQELSSHIDKTDFLNGVVREKKRFETALDEKVAAGLNAGVDLLMNQAEHLVTSHQDARDFYPEPGSDMDLGNPTKACQECISCLSSHCKMLVGSTDKNVLEVFYQEVGMRLHAIICKHLKRQIISLDGGFKVIADLNAYHSFVSSLKQANVTIYFDALKMLGNLYIIDNPKELANIVRDANMFNGTLSPEDLYEFLKARCDFKAIEKAIDKEIYGFKATEDCGVM